jgi:4-hydroxy-tetrahydrodipicolinate reductase
VPLGVWAKRLLRLLPLPKGADLSAALEHPDSSLIGADAGELAGIGRNNIQVVASLHDVADDFDVLIDFSIPAVTGGQCRVLLRAWQKDGYWHYRSRR